MHVQTKCPLYLDKYLQCPTVIDQSKLENRKRVNGNRFVCVDKCSIGEQYVTKLPLIDINCLNIYNIPLFDHRILKIT